MKSDLVDRVRETLAQAGFHATRVDGSGCFDLAARRDARLVLVKVLQNVDALAEEAARDLASVAETLGASALLVGLRSSARDLEDGAVYLRHGIRIVTPTTLAEHLLEGSPPLVHAAPGGFYVRIDGARLRALREARGLSLGDLAAAAGVSRRAIGMYEDGMSTMVDVAFRLEEFLEEDLVEPADPLSPVATSEEDLHGRRALEDVEDAFEREVLATLASLGFRVVPTRRAPFDGIARADRGTVLAGVGSADLAERRAVLLARIAEIFETHGAVVVERRARRVDVAGTPLLDREDLRDADEAGAILDLLADRRRRTRP